MWAKGSEYKKRVQKMMKIYSVTCHCGHVRAEFRREQDLPLNVWDCNCSDCAMRRNLHFMVHSSDFWLVDSADGGEAAMSPTDGSNSALATQRYERNTILYQWGTKTAIRRFCRTCGILPFYTPRSNQDGYAITLPCVDWGEDGPPQIKVQLFDGVNWEQSHAATGIAKETAKDK
mmetsp:Transcript_6687/g.16462  ORF Transcript_6687/g.16462 Transcript_6687/m.16462 type:complete len:175 (+) Transcript_6687:53-577(+)